MRDIAIALDMGNSGGKVIAACMQDGRLEILDEFVIPNEFVEINGHYYWDTFFIFTQLKKAMRKFSQLGRVVSVAVDATSGCYGFVNANKHLAGYVSGSRDPRYFDALKRMEHLISPYELFLETGVFPLDGFNICKLFCDVQDGDLHENDPVYFLQLSGIMQYYLTGEISIERSMAGAAVTMKNDFSDWHYELLERLGIPSHIMPPIAEPGTMGAPLLESVARETNCPDCRFVHTVEFDSSAAMISAPGFDQNKIYLSMGTTINPAVELPAPIINDLAYEYMYKNVPVWKDSYMLLSDVPGFHLVSMCLRAWNARGIEVGHGDLVEMASKETTNSFLDIFDARLMQTCMDMPERIQNFCRETGQEVPETIGQIARVMYESYAVTLAWSIEKLCLITGRDDYEDITAISGGARNALLCKMIADACGRTVRAGNPTATAMGNLLVQFAALGHTDSLEGMRKLASTVCPMAEYEPEENEHLNQGLAFLKDRGFLKA
ncbi:MAG: hypothetical protein J6L88_06940 [Clostridia bacterium]|nr:hypothetical protein [Clostridia bacterium]